MNNNTVTPETINCPANKVYPIKVQKMKKLYKQNLGIVFRISDGMAGNVEAQPTKDCPFASVKWDDKIFETIPCCVAGSKLPSTIDEIYGLFDLEDINNWDGLYEKTF